MSGCSLLNAMQCCAEYTRGEVIQGPATAQQGQLQQARSAPPLGLHIIVYGLVRGSFTGRTT